MPNYFILATRRIELRGVVKADSPRQARKLVRENWYIYDTGDNTITSGSGAPRRAPSPVISEMEDRIQFLHVEENGGKATEPEGR